MENHQPLYKQSYQDIVIYITNHLDIQTKEKDQFAEVSTPVPLIEEIFDRIPLDVWRNPQTRWLDPCVGSGNFSLLLYHRLMSHIYPKKSLQFRHEYILRHMLYMVELNPLRIKQLQKLFGKQANIYHTDFLEWNPPLLIDVIVGNPPYQTTKTTSYKGSAGNKTLWDKFVSASLRILSPNGYMGLITPCNWRRPRHPLYEILTRENQLVYLHIYNKEAGKKWFQGVQTRFDVYVIQNKLPTKTTKTYLIDENGKTYPRFSMNPWTAFLPNSMYSTIQEIMVTGTDKDPGIDVLFDSTYYDARKLHKTQTAIYKYPVVHTVGNQGIGFLYAKDDECFHYHQKKVILNFNEKLYPINDWKGEYGMSQLNFGIPIRSKKEGEEVIRALMSPVWRSIIEATKWASFQTDYRMFQYFHPDLREPTKGTYGS
jgi:hypothetical protein